MKCKVGADSRFSQPGAEEWTTLGPAMYTPSCQLSACGFNSLRFLYLQGRTPRVTDAPTEESWRWLGKWQEPIQPLPPNSSSDRSIDVFAMSGQVHRPKATAKLFKCGGLHVSLAQRAIWSYRMRAESIPRSKANGRRSAI